MTEINLTLDDPALFAQQLKHAANHWDDGGSASPMGLALHMASHQISDQIESRAQQTFDTYIANDADDDPTLWLKEPGRHTPKGLISRQELRIAMGISPFSPSLVHVDRLWAAIAATAGPAPEEEQ